MNGITILSWITIAIIGIIAIILVKLHYKGDELEADETSILPSSESINKALSTGQEIISKNINRNSTQQNQNNNVSLKRENTPSKPKFEAYIVPEIETNNNQNYEYSSENQVLINYDNSVEKFQEPIKQTQIDIMTQNNDTPNEKHELKDLFTIDELIKESKRKDSEREKEAKNNEEDLELAELKESIKNKQEKVEINDDLIEKIEADIKEMKKETISELIEEDETPVIDEVKPAETEKIENSSISPKDIEEAINTASQETAEEEVESISESKNITDILLNDSNNESETEEESKKETVQSELKAPKKIDEERKDYKFGADLEENEVFGDDDNDLDYRKDLAKITNTIKSSKLFQEVKEKITPETEEIEPMDESFIRNVNDYEDEFAPIVNETHVDYEASYEDYHNMDSEQRLRQENTRKVFNMAKNSSPEPELAEAKIGAIKEKPERDNIKIQLNNNEVVLKKGDEIIYNHLGETYSSQVYAIKGDDISVRYRRKDITIKPSDVKKIY